MRDTTSGTETALTRLREARGLDELFTSVAVEKTMGQVVMERSRSLNARGYFVANTICCAIFDLDIGLIAEIVKRIDGLAPSKGDNNGYSEIFGDALLDVLDYGNPGELRIFPSDPVIVALAKAAIAVANADVGKNMQARKDRQKAVQMILDRTEGRRSEPAKPVEETVYEAPAWLGLGEGESNAGGEDAKRA